MEMVKVESSYVWANVVEGPRKLGVLKHCMWFLSYMW